MGTELLYHLEVIIINNDNAVNDNDNDHYQYH